MNPVCHRYNQSWNKRNEHLLSTQRYPHEAHVTPLPLCFHENYGFSTMGPFHVFILSAPCHFPHELLLFHW